MFLLMKMVHREQHIHRQGMQHRGPQVAASRVSAVSVVAATVMAQAARAALRGGLKRLSPRLTSMGGSRSDLKPEYLTRYRILESPGTRRVVLTATQSHTIDKRAAESLAWKLMAWENNYMIRVSAVCRSCTLPAGLWMHFL